MTTVQGLPSAVSDARANAPELIVHVADSIGRSVPRRKVFEAVYYHKKRIKTVSEIQERTDLPRKRVLQLGRELVQRGVVGQTRRDGQVAYEQDPFIQAHKVKILRLVNKPSLKKKVVTKRNPRPSLEIVDKRMTVASPTPQYVTIDRIDSFAAVHEVPPVVTTPLPEARFKAGLQNILGEKGDFRDWGGEQNDLFTSRLLLSGKRRRVAFALKGPAVKGKLQPRHMGKNGDQIQRLFLSPAEVFLIQYHGQVSEAVHAQMETFARDKSRSLGERVYYGVIDGQDSSRLIAAYQDEFAATE